MVISKSSLAEWRQVLEASALTSIGIYIFWRTATTAVSGGGMRLFLLITLLNFACSIIARSLARRTARSIAPLERCVIIGNPLTVTALAQRLSSAPGVELVGVIPEESLTGSLAELRAAVEELDVHRLVIASASGASDQSTLHLIQAARFIGVRVSLLPSVMTAVGGVAAFDEVDGLMLLGVPRFGLTRSSENLKRLFDLIVGTVTLIAVSPVLVVITILIKADSRGPVLFRQTRVGRGGRPFEIYKFRSMIDGADAMKPDLLMLNEASEGLFKIALDPRVTRVGRFLRSAHLDELPQLVNVLRGEMSLVGPRPLVSEEDARVIGRDRHRVRLTPGMTGPWQVRGPMNTPLAEMAMLDYRYASNWSIWSDLDILLQTAMRVLRRNGH
jgi:exopolysaccharide biosynthesis polyprenyl glycosylphosphotransferase